MPKEARNRFYSMGPTPREKWQLLAPYWPAVKNTGYAKGASISLRELYGVEELSADTVDKAQEGYEKVRRRGFYRHVLRDAANVESSQVNCLERPFLESETPTLLMARPEHRRHVQPGPLQGVPRADGRSTSNASPIGTR